MSSGNGKKKPPPERVASPEARRAAGVVLEVLAGERSPGEAAEALGISPPAYYLLESRALEGLVHGCEPRPKGRVVTAQSELQALRKQCARLERESARYQALARVAQRTAGVPAKKKPDSKPAAGRRKRKPAVRALKLAQRLTGPAAEPPASGAH